MVLKSILFHRNNILVLLLLVLTANITLYYTAFGVSVLSESATGVIVGSIIDLALVIPLLFIAWKQNWSIKNITLAIASGLVLVRFLIPIEYLEPFVAITWIGFAIEAIIVLLEVYLVFLLVKYLPAIIRSVKNSSLPTVFSFSNAVDSHINGTPLVKAICTEMLFFYYAFGSWRKKLHLKGNMFTLHKRSSMIAVNVMLLHSILIETIVIHWW